MKKLILYILLAFTTLIYGDCICFYNDAYYYTTQETCKIYAKFFKDVFNETCEIKPLYKFEDNKTYDKVILVSMGHYKGVWKEEVSSPENITEDNFITYKQLAKVKANIMILDACYVGYIFDYHPIAKYVITSTGKENSWNPLVYIKNSGYKNIGSLALALNCMFNHKFHCPINCIGTDINTCQLSLIFNMFYSQIWDYKLYSNELYDWEFPSMGSCMINGIPCRSFIK